MYQTGTIYSCKLTNLAGGSAIVGWNIVPDSALNALWQQVSSEDQICLPHTIDIKPLW